MAPRKKTDIIQLSKIRMREVLRAKLARDAERKGVTLNAEIVDRLERSYDSEAQVLRDSTIVDLAELTKRVVGLLGSGVNSDGSTSFSAQMAQKRLGRAIQAHPRDTASPQLGEQDSSSERSVRPTSTVADRATELAGALRRDLEVLEKKELASVRPSLESPEDTPEQNPQQKSET